MSRTRTFDTRVDRAVRRSGLTRRAFAEEALVSTASLYKARALDPERGRLHWTTLVLIGIRLGIFAYGELVNEDDPRLRKLAPRRLISSRGSRAHKWYG